MHLPEPLPDVRTGPALGAWPVVGKDAEWL